MIVDWFSKEIIPIACTTELSSEGWAKILWDEVYAKHRMPQVVISDRGTMFVSKFMKDLYDLLQIKANASTAYHPQTDGQTEQVNQEVKKYLRIFINHLQNDWVEWLSLTAFAHNNHVHSATGKSPFEVNYGYNANILPGAKPQAPFRMPRVHHLCFRHTEIHEEAKRALEKAADQMKAQYNKKKQPAIEYQKGDKVWLDTTNLNPPTTKEKTRWQTHRSISHCRKERSISVHTENSRWIGAFTPHSMNHSSPHIHHPHSPTKNNPLHCHQILSTMKNTTKSRKSSTVENAKSEEKPENHGTGLQITLSNGKAMDQSQTAGYGKTAWTPMNLSTSTLLNTWTWSTTRRTGSTTQTQGQGRNSGVGRNYTNSGTYSVDMTTLLQTLNRPGNRRAYP